MSEYSERQGLERRLRGLPLRAQMCAILASVAAIGVLANFVAREFGLGALWLRYALAVSLAYAAFFALARLWLALALRGERVVSRRARSARSDLDSDVSDAWLTSTSGSGPGAADWAGGGGRFNGAGASETWSDGAAAVDLPANLAPASKTTDGDSGAADDSGDLAIVVAIVAMIVVIVGAAGFLVYAGPDILVESALQFAFGRGLFKTLRAGSGLGPSWQRSLFQETWKPFAIVLVTVVAVGGYASWTCPHATRLFDLRAPICKTP